MPLTDLFRESSDVHQAHGLYLSLEEGQQQAETAAGDGLLHRQVKVAAVSSCQAQVSCPGTEHPSAGPDASSGGGESRA